MTVFAILGKDYSEENESERKTENVWKTIRKQKNIVMAVDSFSQKLYW
jgi:hypothetical protein